MRVPFPASLDKEVSKELFLRLVNDTIDCMINTYNRFEGKCSYTAEMIQELCKFEMWAFKQDRDSFLPSDYFNTNK